MKKLLTFLGAGAFVVACGGSTNDTDGGNGGDGSMPVDSGVKTDGSMNGDSGNGMDSGSGMDSGNMNDGGGPMDGGIECMDPTTCGGGNMYCCATVTAAMGQPPQCFFNGTYSTKCTMSCNSNFNPMCGSTSTRRMCNMKSQCTEQAYNQCCTVMLNNQNVSICMSAQEAQIAMAQCK